MESLQLRYVQISPAHHSPLPVHKQLLSTKCGAQSFASISRLRGSERFGLHFNQINNDLFTSNDASSFTSKIWCCAAAHPPTYGYPSGFDLNKSNFKAQDEQTPFLRNLAAKITPDLKGKCIFLVGMMGSGKSTVGHVLADALGYQFADSDKVIEEKNGGMSVAEFFNLQNEDTFRDAETNVLKELSNNRQLVVGTGGGIVIRPQNWRYLRHGLTVWLDVPLEALAERVVAAGMHSRPLLGGHEKGGSGYSKALATLMDIYDNRALCYAKANARVSVQKLASRLGCHVRDLSPTLIAIQALEEIKNALLSEEGNGQ